MSWSFPLSLVSPGGRFGRLSILIFHRVLATRDPLRPDEPDAAEFEAQMRWVRGWFNVMPLGDAVERLYQGRLPPRALAVTFDDGYADNVEIAAPVLHRLGMTATFFVSTAYLDGGCMWNDRIIEAIAACRGERLELESIGFASVAVDTVAARRDAVGSLLRRIRHLEGTRRSEAVDAVTRAAGAPDPGRLMMTPRQLLELRSMGMDVGAHTMTHPILTRLAPAAAAAEIGGARERLEQVLGERITLFAYPNGVPHQDYGPEHVRIAQRCGFAAAVSTAWGAASRRSDRYQLPRFTPWDRNRFLYGARMLANFARAERRVDGSPGAAIAQEAA